MDVTPNDPLDTLDALEPDETLIDESAVPEVSAEERSVEEAAARRLAERYRLEFLNMQEFRIDQDLFRSIPADLMLRYGFVPYRRRNNRSCSPWPASASAADACRRTK